MPGAMFLCVGEALYDLIQQGPDLHFTGRLGGSPLNVAIGLARLGRPAAFLGSIGNDFLGEAMRASLVQEGVDITLATASDAPTSLALVTLRADGVPDYSFSGLGDGATYRVPATLHDTIRVIHVGSVGAAFGPSAPALLDLLRDQHARRLVCYDPNPRPSVMPDADAWRRRVAPIAACANLIKVSIEDLAFLYPGSSPEAVAERWLQGGATRLVVVTDGAAGARAFTPSRVLECPGLNVVVADTVGAGDTFQAALLSGCAAHRALTGAALGALPVVALERILSFAVSAGALACTRLGAATPSRAELRCFGRSQTARGFAPGPC